MAGAFIDTPAPKFIDAPAPKFIDAPAPTATPTPKPGKSPLQKAGDVVQGGFRNVNAARTAAARDPVGALGNVLGAPERAIAGLVMGPMTEVPKTDTNLGHQLAAGPIGAWKAVTDPKQGDRYNQAFGDMLLGPAPKKPTMPQRIGRGAANFALQTAIDPVTHGGGAAAKMGLGALGAASGAVAPHVEQTVANLKHLASPEVVRAAGVLAHAVGQANPLPGIVNAGKDMLFLNPFPHGLGNMATLNFLRNGLGTTAQGLRYGVTGAPAKTAAELERIGAGAWTPELMGQPSPWGPVGWMNAARKAGVPAAVRATGGGAVGGAAGYQTAPSNATPGQRLSRGAEGAILGALTGASPEVLNASNQLMSRLETGHRAAMLESLPKLADVPKPKPHISAKEAAALIARRKAPEVLGPAANPALNRAARPSGLGSPNLFQHGMRVESKPAVDPRTAEINAAFGGGDKGPVAKIATALGGPFAQWQAEVVPRAVGRTLTHVPARVEAIARAQDITNRDVLPNKPYKLQTGGPIGGFSEMAFNTPKYASRLLGPLGNVDPSSATKPNSFSLGDALKGAAYQGVPGRSVVGPAFGDTMYPTKAPAGPSAALNDLLGWHFANKTPRQDAILSIMRSSGLNATEAGHLYDRMKPR
jgi:hypothetical protein